jgi:hypothetical protein
VQGGVIATAVHIEKVEWLLTETGDNEIGTEDFEVADDGMVPSYTTHGTQHANNNNEEDNNGDGMDWTADLTMR